VRSYKNTRFAAASSAIIISINIENVKVYLAIAVFMRVNIVYK